MPYPGNLYDYKVLLVDASGNAIGGTGTSAQQVQGNVATGAAVSGGNPLGLGLQGTSNLLEYGRTASLAAGTSGAGLLGTALLGFNAGDTNYYRLLTESNTNPNLRVALYQGASIAVIGGAVDGNSGVGLITNSFQAVFNGTNWDRQRSASVLDTGLTTGVPASHTAYTDDNNGTFVSVAGKSEYRYRVVSAVATQQQVVIDLRNLHDTLAIQVLTSAGTPNLTVESSSDNSNWITIDTVATPVVKQYTATTVGATVALSPLAFRWVRVTVASAGGGNTSTLTIGAK